MLSTGTEIFLQIPGESDRRILHPGTIVAVGDTTHTAEFEEEDLAPEAGQEVFIYYQVKRRFMQQPARVDAVMETKPKVVIGFQTTGEPVSAERRGFDRVSTVITDLTLHLGFEVNCPLLEVSAVGFSVIATDLYDVGNVVDATLCYRDMRFAGRACVESVKELGDARLRYGLVFIDDKVAGGNLKKGLHLIGMAVQRQGQRRKRTG